MAGEAELRYSFPAQKFRRQKTVRMLNIVAK